MDAETIIREFPKGLLNWYGFKPSSNVLYITEKNTSLEELLKERCGQVLSVDKKQSVEEGFQKQYKGFFDYIVAVGVAERLKEPIKTLSYWKKLCNPGGRLLLGTDNRLGLRYFCGDQDPFTNRSFDGIENYRRVQRTDRDFVEGRSYSRDELHNMLEEAGWEENKFYAVLPNLDAPQLIYAEGYLPQEELSIRYFPAYYHPDSVFLEEEFLYTDIIKNGMFHAMANSYLIECTLGSGFENVRHVTLSMDRGKENALATIIRENDTVEKRILYDEGKGKLERLRDNASYLKAHKIPVLDFEIKERECVMPYVNYDVLLPHWHKLARTDVEKLLEEIDAFYRLILDSSDILEPHKVKNPEGMLLEGLGPILKRGYWDLVPLNCFYNKGSFLFYDQEFYEENYPAKAILFRSLQIIYASDWEMEAIIPQHLLWKRYALEEEIGVWQRYSYETTVKLRHQKVLRRYYERIRRDSDTVNTNRQRMNYSEGEYQRVFVDLFRNAADKKIVLFGSGNFAKRFLTQFKGQRRIYAIVDNNPSKWGQKLEGINIYSPEFMSKIPPEERRIIICAKGYMGIVCQLKQMGIDEFCIYDTNVEYTKALKTTLTVEDSMSVMQKKYHTGYVAGVFDLFHIGHLNMFRRAKEQCDYLIVGIVTDEWVRRNKKKPPFIPFEERREMIKACRYVDEVVEVPLNYCSIRDAYKMHHFDCQFSGSDYLDNPDWLADKAFLEKQGAELVFFPYTESTSSTKIKQLIEKSLL